MATQASTLAQAFLNECKADKLSVKRTLKKARRRHGTWAIKSNMFGELIIFKDYSALAWKNDELRCLSKAEQPYRLYKDIPPKNPGDPHIIEVEPNKPVFITENTVAAYEAGNIKFMLLTGEEAKPSYIGRAGSGFNATFIPKEPQPCPKATKK